MNLLNLFLAFVYKEIRTAASFKFITVTKFLYFFLQVSIFYYISRFVSKDYFIFVFLGLLFSRTFHKLVLSFVETLKQEQYYGTVYILFSTCDELTALLTSAMTKFIFLYVEVILLILLSNMFLNLNFGINQLITIVLWMLWIAICLLWYTILITSVLLTTHKTESLCLSLAYIIDILSGVYFPTTLLPLPLQYVSKLLPTTYMLDFIRMLILQDKFCLSKTLYPTLVGLLLLPWMNVLFNYSLKKALKDGKLVSY